MYGTEFPAGHYVAATQVSKNDIEIEGTDNITWFQSSETAKRGICKTCGSQLFWTEIGSGHVSVMAGTVDGPTELMTDRQLYPEAKGVFTPCRMLKRWINRRCKLDPRAA